MMELAQLSFLYLCQAIQVKGERQVLCIVMEPFRAAIPWSLSTKQRLPTPSDFWQSQSNVEQPDPGTLVRADENGGCCTLVSVCFRNFLELLLLGNYNCHPWRQVDWLINHELADERVTFSSSDFCWQTKRLLMTAKQSGMAAIYWQDGSQPRFSANEIKSWQSNRDSNSN